jgi:hypothetical protein
MALPKDYDARKAIPIATGVLDYFPDALAEVAKCSVVGNEQHSPGEPLHWARGKSMDQANTLIRHFLERGETDSDGVRHSAKVAWRALALLQLEIEAAQAAADDGCGAVVHVNTFYTPRGEEPADWVARVHPEDFGGSD